MIRIKRAALGAVFVLAVILASTFVYMLDEDNRRNAAATILGELIDGDVSIEGPVNIDLSLTPSVMVQDLTVRDADGKQWSAQIGKLDVEFDFDRLPFEILSISRLSIVDADVRLDLPPDLVGSPDAGDIDLPFIESLLLERTRLIIEEGDGEELVDIEIDRFGWDAVDIDGPIYLEAIGTVNGFPATLSGTLGAIDNALLEDASSPVNIGLVLPGFDIVILGDIADLSDGEGLNLKIDVEILDTARMGEILGREIPAIGAIYAVADVSGDVDAPTLTGLNVRLEGEDILIEATGAVIDAFRFTGLDIALNATAGLEGPLNDYLPDELRRYEPHRIELSGQLKGELRDLAVEDLRAIIETAGLIAEFDGAAKLAASFDDLRVVDVNLRSKFSSPSTSSLAPSLELPELGPLVGEATLTGGDDRLAITELQVSIGADGPLEIKLAGRGPTNLFDAVDPLAGLDLALDIAAQDTSRLSDVLATKIPSLGPLIATGRLIRDAEATRIVDTNVRVVGGDRLRLSAIGNIDAYDDGRQNVDIAVAFSTENLTNLAASMDLQLPDLGKASGEFRLRGDAQSLSLSDIAIDARSTLGPEFQITGAVGAFRPAATMPLTDIELVVSIAGSNTDWLSEFVGSPVPDLGRFSGRSKLTGTSDVLTLDALEFGTTAPDGLITSVQGGIENVSVTKDVRVSGVTLRVDVSAPNAAALAHVIGVPVAELGEITASAELNDIDGNIGLGAFRITRGTPNDPRIIVTGTADNLFIPNELKISADVDIAIAEVLGALYARPFPDVGRLKGSVMLSDTDGRLGIESLSFTTDGPGRLELVAKGVTDDIANANDIDLMITFTGDSLSVLNLPPGHTGLPDRPFHVDGRLTVTNRQPKFQGDVRLGATTMHIELGGTLDGERPRISGFIKSNQFDLRDFAGPLDAPRQPDGDRETANLDPSEKVFSETLIPFDALHEIDLNVDINFDNVTSGPLIFSDLDAKIELNGGLLEIKPLTLLYAGGQTNISMRVNANASPPIVSLNGSGNDYPMGTVLETLDKEPVVQGKLSMKIDLTGAGHSARQIASSLNGSFGFALEEGRLKNVNLRLMAPDEFDWLLAAPTFNQDSPLECVISHLAIEDGIAIIESLLIVSSKMSVSGVGTVDLKNEYIDLVVAADQKRFVPLSFNKPVKIHGPLSSPAVEPDLSGHVGDTVIFAAGSIALPYVFIPLKAAGYLMGVLDEPNVKSLCLEGKSEN